MVYFAAEGHDCAPNGWVYGLRARDGVVAWQVPFERVLLPARALQNGVLFIGSSTYPATDERDYLTALRASDGAVLWRQQLDIYASYTAASNGMVVLGGSFEGGRGGVEARRARDGAVLWRYHSSGQYDTPAPYIFGDTVYFSGHDGTFYALRARDGALKWRFSTGARTVGPPTVAGDLVYVGAGTTLYGLSTRTGAIMRAYHPFADQGLDNPSTIFSAYSAPVISDGVIFVAATARPCRDFCASGFIDSTLFALDAETGAQLWARTESPGLPLALTLGP
jgi:outer membrane protein assembly factor BamB